MASIHKMSKMARDEFKAVSLNKHGGKNRSKSKRNPKWSFKKRKK